MQQIAPRPIVHRWMRPIYFLLGSLFLIVGIVGIAAPLIPTTGPVLLAAFFFARSSDRFHDWLINHPRLGPLIADFRSGKGIPMATKVWALAAMTLAFGFTVIFVPAHWSIRVALAVVGLWAIHLVARLPVARR
jgi:uncharacterized membrane protein YbaN (DUF454 family)